MAPQQIQSGQVIVVPATEIPGMQGGGTDILDLNSPTGDEIDGLFLPSRRRFRLCLPRPLASSCAREAPFVCVRDLELTSHTVYLDTFRLQVWTANGPTLPTANDKKTH